MAETQRAECTAGRAAACTEEVVPGRMAELVAVADRVRQHHRSVRYSDDCYSVGVRSHHWRVACLQRILWLKGPTSKL